MGAGRDQTGCVPGRRPFPSPFLPPLSCPLVPPPADPLSPYLSAPIVLFFLSFTLIPLQIAWVGPHQVWTPPGCVRTESGPDPGRVRTGPDKPGLGPGRSRTKRGRGADRKDQDRTNSGPGPRWAPAGLKPVRIGSGPNPGWTSTGVDPGPGWTKTGSGSSPTQARSYPDLARTESGLVRLTRPGDPGPTTNDPVTRRTQIPFEFDLPLRRGGRGWPVYG
jgi:hypothetical protein